MTSTDFRTEGKVVEFNKKRENKSTVFKKVLWVYPIHEMICCCCLVFLTNLIHHLVLQL